MARDARVTAGGAGAASMALSIRSLSKMVLFGVRRTDSGSAPAAARGSRSWACRALVGRGLLPSDSEMVGGRSIVLQVRVGGLERWSGPLGEAGTARRSVARGGAYTCGWRAEPS